MFSVTYSMELSADVFTWTIQ